MTTKTAKITAIVSGMRPTGPLHLGHYHGVIQNWLALQARHKEFPLYFFVADLHSLTTAYEHPGETSEFSRGMILDWLACGIDAKKVLIFVQSQVPEHAELFALLSMIAPIGWLERVPSYKEMREELKDRDLSTYGFLGYPLLQTADVALYKASHVPVGEDQVAHLEFGREILRRFNFLYKRQVFVEPQPLLAPSSKLLGLDARKMSKSYDNCIYLTDAPETVNKKLARAYTDPKRLRRTDPGEPNDCNVYSYHKIYTDSETRAEIEVGCRSAGLGCVDCKKILAGNVNQVLAPIAERRKAFESKPNLVADIVRDGSKTASEAARPVLEEAQSAMGLWRSL